MKIKYTGPKESISAHGISFKRGKDDKYVYIYPAFQLYNAIHHEYEKDIIYTYNVEGKRLNDEALFAQLLTLNSNLQTMIEEDLNMLNSYLEEEIEKSASHKEYDEEERKVYKNNLLLMKEYRIQRETNKIVYKNLIKIIVDDIIEHRLKEMSAPFNERYWHIFQTIQGELSNHNKRSIGSTLDIHHENSALTIFLKINAIGK